MRPLCPIILVLALAVPALAAGKPAQEARKPEPPEMQEDDNGLGPLLHASPERVKARLGDPDVSRAEGRGAFWTYRLEHCALFLFFHEGPHGLRLTGASTGPRKRGEPLLTVQACLASAVQLPE